MKLNLSDEPLTAELLAEALARAGSAVIAVNGTSMHPTLQMGWRVFLEPARGVDLRIGEIAVFRGDHHLTIHRLVWRERGADGCLIFRGDHNRTRERVPPTAVIARVVAVEVPGGGRQGRIVALETDILGRFYRVAYLAGSLLRPVLPATDPQAPPGPFGRAVRAMFRTLERLVGIFLPQRR